MSLRTLSLLIAAVAGITPLAARTPGADLAAVARDAPALIGTTEPMAAHAVYFVMTDRFVNGDPSNDHREQGLPDHGT
ncbi:MAG TPA: hypothetical protein DCM32_03405, partial [Xanthomonadaceae bacterium]|nr:hypothetical protein [Xanthomonadaceae bacterium]